MAFQKHIEAIKSGVVTKTNVIGIRKAINANERREYGYSVGSTAPNVTPSEIDQAYGLLATVKPRVTGELHDTGLKLLRSPRYAKRLSPYRSIIDDITSFHLVGYEQDDGNTSPRYAARDSKGREFEFVNVPWQSGGNGPQIVRG